MSFLREFRQFALRGNVLDLAIGIIIGAAFGKIVSSLVEDVIMPPLGLLIGGSSFKQCRWELKSATVDAPALVMEYGRFLQNTFDFIIVAFSVFCLIQLINQMYRKEKKTESECTHVVSVEEQLLIEIRDLLQKNAKIHCCCCRNVVHDKRVNCVSS